MFIFCMYVCVDFVCRVWGFFLTGGGYVVPCSCTKDKNSINKILLLVLFAIQLQNTGHIFLLHVFIVSLGKKNPKCLWSPSVPKNHAAPVFHFMFYFQIYREKNAPKRFRLIRENVVHSCTGNMWCQITEAMVWPYCSRVDYNCRCIWYGSDG